MTGLVENEHRLGPPEDIPVGEGRAYAVGDLQIAVFRLRSGALRATQAVCPHAGGPLADGQLDDDVVLCPLHAAAFDLETGQARTAHPPLTVYPVRVADGCLVVSTAAPPEAPALRLLAPRHVTGPSGFGPRGPGQPGAGGGARSLSGAPGARRRKEEQWTT